MYIDKVNIEFNLSGSRYQLQLVSGESKLINDQVFLRVIEISPFKHLTHLSLLFTSANDHEIKSYLARCLQSKKVKQMNIFILIKILFYRRIIIN